jgi:hypothetical protein
VLSVDQLEPLLRGEPKCALCTRRLLAACETTHPRQSSLNRKDNDGNYERTGIELCCYYCNLLLGHYYNGPAVFRSILVDDGTAEPTAAEKAVMTTYVQYLLNLAVFIDKSRNLWRRVEIRDILERQKWRCADLHRLPLWSAATGCFRRRIGSIMRRTTTCAATFGSSLPPPTSRGRL